jgi:hypothetical protein
MNSRLIRHLLDVAVASLIQLGAIAFGVFSIEIAKWIHFAMTNGHCNALLEPKSFCHEHRCHERGWGRPGFVPADFLPPWIRRSSSLHPDRRAEANERGYLPRPDQTSLARLGYCICAALSDIFALVRSYLFRGSSWVLRTGVKARRSSSSKNWPSWPLHSLVS